MVDTNRPFEGTVQPFVPDGERNLWIRPKPREAAHLRRAPRLLYGRPQLALRKFEDGPTAAGGNNKHDNVAVRLAIVHSKKNRSRDLTPPRCDPKREKINATHEAAFAGALQREAPPQQTGL